MSKKKKQGIRIPKRVGGVKVPKEWREGGEALIAQAQSPAGRAAIAKGVSVVAGLALTAAKSAGRSAEVKTAAPAKAPETGTAAMGGPSPTPPADQIAQAVGAGVEAVLGRLFARR